MQAEAIDVRVKPTVHRNTPVIPALEKLRQEDHTFGLHSETIKEAGLSQLSRTRLSCGQSPISGHIIIGSARMPTVRGSDPSGLWLRGVSINA